MIAIVLIQTESGKAFSACGEIGQIEGIERAHVVTGPYDLIAVANGNNCNLRCLVAAIHEVQGVQRTETCIAVS